MRALLVAVTIAVAACSTGPSAPDSIAGSWANDSISLALTESGDQLSGTAFVSPNTYLVSGTYDRPNVTLNLQQWLGGDALGSGFNLTGQAVSANTMVLGTSPNTSTLHRQ